MKLVYYAREIWDVWFVYLRIYEYNKKERMCTERVGVCRCEKGNEKVEEIEKSDGKYDEEIKVKKNVRGEK